MIKKTHLHHLFIGYREMKKAGKDDVLVEATEIQVIGRTTEKNALDRAKQILQREKYHLKKVWECGTCQVQEETVLALKELVKEIGRSE